MALGSQKMLEIEDEVTVTQRHQIRFFFLLKLGKVTLVPPTGVSETAKNGEETSQAKAGTVSRY